ncbi:hypothetical protein SAMN05216188_102162 [Lentzea xinjiangensis]|uniref:Uncharacterized protein n=1 Tax=Lentzea xinjiangensis TaxID=402600 RepID=A0A1H9DHW0_9PSEU|nr:hypothetical protein [Lentzea xinjiangensis]SEQ13080.1 hypothetical protein SAMN05216188_102162 [Lentzea xinjiangensis]
MERITEDQISRLVGFVDSRVSDPLSTQDEGDRRMATALRMVVNKQIAAVRYYRASLSGGVVTSEVHAISAWNSLVSIALIWQNHPEFPADAAIETFEFDAANPLLPEPARRPAPPDDQDLWAAVVAADRRLARARADFHQHAAARREVLADALALRPSNAWECGSALSFLSVLPEDVPALVDQLVECATLDGWALEARSALAAGRRAEVLPLVRQAVDRRLPIADALDYRRLAELLHHVGDEEALHALVESARGHGEQEVRDLADELLSG